MGQRTTKIMCVSNDDVLEHFPRFQLPTSRGNRLKEQIAWLLGPNGKPPRKFRICKKTGHKNLTCPKKHGRLEILVYPQIFCVNCTQSEGTFWCILRIFLCHWLKAHSPAKILRILFKNLPHRHQRWGYVMVQLQENQKWSRWLTSFRTAHKVEFSAALAPLFALPP